MSDICTIDKVRVSLKDSILVQLVLYKEVFLEDNNNIIFHNY